MLPRQPLPPAPSPNRRGGAQRLSPPLRFGWGEERAQALADAPVGRDVGAVRVPGARSGVVAEIDGDKRNASLDEPTRQQRLLAPQVLAVALPHALRLPRQIERLAGPAADHQL